MKALNREFAHVNQAGLDEALEPLASFICAADRPSEALETVLSALFSQVTETNRVAKAGIASFLNRRTQVVV